MNQTARLNDPSIRNIRESTAAERRVSGAMRIAPGARQQCRNRRIAAVPGPGVCKCGPGFAGVPPAEVPGALQIGTLRTALPTMMTLSDIKLFESMIARMSI
jgi:hypothetical protein